MLVQGKTTEYGECYHSFENNFLVIATAAFPSDLTVIDEQTGILPSGRYSVDVNYSYNHDSPTNDFMTLFSINGALAHQQTGFMNREQPHDANGAADFPATGSNQVYGFHKRYYTTLATPGTISVLLEVATETAGVESSIWDTNIEIKAAPLQ